MLAFDNYEEGYNSVLSYSNGLKELVQRKDAGEKMLNFYDSLKDSCQPIELVYTEIILSQPAIMNLLNINEKRDLLQKATDRYKKKGYSLFLNSIQQNEYQILDYGSYVLTPEGSEVPVTIHTYDYPDEILVLQIKKWMLHFLMLQDYVLQPDIIIVILMHGIVQVAVIING